MHVEVPLYYTLAVTVYCAHQMLCFFFHTANRNLMSIESASSSPDLARPQTHSRHRNRSFGVGQGLSEVDVATRQRYFENSG